jgi:hypothetical protein
MFAWVRWLACLLVVATLPSAAAPAHADKWALPVGIGQYEDERIAPLRYSVADPTGLSEALVDPAGGGVATDHVYLLTDARLSAGHLEYSTQTGALAIFTFTGTGLKWHASKGPGMRSEGDPRRWIGDAGGSVCGEEPTRVLPVTGLANRQHALMIEVSDRKNPSATGYMVTLDALEVVP